MAYNESGELPVGQGYWLGNYSFELHVDQVHEPGEEDVVSVYAICRSTNPDGTQESRETQAVDFPVGAEVESWSVEANETEASVYAVVKTPKEDADKKKGSPFDLGVWPNPVAYTQGNAFGESVKIENSGYTAILLSLESKAIYPAVMASQSPGQTARCGVHWGAGEGDWMYSNVALNNSFTYDEKTVYWGSWSAGYSGADLPGTNMPVASVGGNLNEVAWTIVYGTPSYDPEDFDEKEELIGRFAINLKDADGGPGGGWDEPGSVEPDPDPGEPEQTHTLTLTAIAALSGRHNDPLDDTSYSYLPADNTTIKPYGCGGDGGHGGGGGGGASTMVIHKIATDKASHVEVVARTKRHGYGSGGSKGGKGGDGCILVFW